MNNNHNTTFKKLQQSNTYIPTSPTPSISSSPQLNNNNGEMMKKIWKSCGKKALLKFKLVELKEELRKKSLTLNGNKAEIVERLHEKYMSEESNNTSTTNSIDNNSPESSSSNSSSSPAIKSSLTTTPNSNSSINERKSAYMKRNSNSAAVTFAPFSAMNNTQSPISPPKIDNTPSRFSSVGSTNSPPLSSNKKGSSISLPPPPTLSQLPSSLYNPPLFYNKGNNYPYPKLPSLPPYPQYGVPNYSYYPMFQPTSTTSNALTPATTSTITNGAANGTTTNGTTNGTTINTTNNNTNLLKKKKKKENAALKPAKQKEEVDTDEFLSLEEIECYNSQIDYNSSSDETFTQKRSLSDTELYIETFENEALNNLLYSSTPHKKKQKQEHEFYEDLFYDRNKDLVDQEQVIETNQEVITNNIHSNDIGFRVKCIIDGNMSEEKDVFIRDDKKWEDVVNHLLNDYRSFYNYFNFEFIPNDFNAILHSKCEDVHLLSNSTIQSSSLSNRDSITINLRVVDHSCQFDLQVDSITSLNLHSYEDEEEEKEEKEDGYDQDDEDDDDEEEEEEEESTLTHPDLHEEEQVIQDDLYDQQVLLNLIESI
ncbi:hypothetical protein NAEGRDRAFT_81150 [Naegleria gruberi]|uniref:SAP domain-containing protein n=1 Tax=Naegleria gruberi TaxID=5762 RepID=D2VT87_NAEGR|nr:uncharacterized protein NAEGRDRAFT_81150 [Naegleria gruberi]EFC40104.1 hypothetical protein NAEGRDRAFT_81150 [Naegleria gruberi]|eukprot:XP_002672848.1 hypothetical protein NAEGRDRAFT_81150 [Naegleria gruberi strain NEG-M]